MSIKKLDYTSFDFNSIKNNLINVLSQENVFKDYNFSGSNVNTIIELISAVGDLFNYYISMSANEGFIQSASLYENVNKLAELVGYNPRGYKSSSVSITLVSDPTKYPATNKNNYKINIPKFSRFTTLVQTNDKQDIFFTNPEAILFTIDTSSLGANGEFTIPVNLVQGNPTDLGSEESFVGNGEIFQSYNISDLKAIEEHIIVTVDGTEYTYVKNLFRNTKSTDTIFTTRYNKEQKVEIRFGDNINGVAPISGSVIKIRYVSSLGLAGNVSSGAINSISSNIYQIDSTGTSSVLSGGSSSFIFNQLTASVGGVDPEDIESLRSHAPAFFSTQDRAVTLEDYENLLLSNYGQFVLRVKALRYEDIFSNTQKLSSRLSQTAQDAITNAVTGLGLGSSSPLSASEATSLLQSPNQVNQTIYYNNVYLVIVPVFGTQITAGLRSDLEELLFENKMITINHVFLDPTYVDITSVVEYSKSSTTSRTTSEIELDIQNIILNYLDKNNRNLGDLLKHSEVVSSLSAISGIDVILLNWGRDAIAPDNINIQLSNLEFPKFKSLTITAQ